MAERSEAKKWEAKLRVKKSKILIFRFTILVSLRSAILSYRSKSRKIGEAKRS